MRRVTLKQIAERSGLSVSTVSLILSGKAHHNRISQEAIALVDRTAKAMDYSPNLLVHNMQTGRTHIMTFFNCFRYVSGDDDPYSVRLTTATNRAAGELGYNVMTFCSFPPTVEGAYHSLNGGHCDGVILFAARPDEPLLDRFRPSRLPAVLLNTADPEGVLSSVRDDVADGMRQAVEAIRLRGHRRIAAITDAGPNPNAPQRIALLRQYADDAGLDLPEERLVEAGSDEDASEAVAYLMRSDQPPTALFCWRDSLAVTAVQTCERMGIEVPTRLSVVGYDGISFPDRTSHRIASVHVDLIDIGRRAVTILDGLISGKASKPTIDLRPVQFLEGTTLTVPPTGSL